MIRILLYADDGAIVAEFAADLQRMLDALHSYCCKSRLIVNVEKTEVMILHDKTPLDELNSLGPNFFCFMYNGSRMRVVDVLKYLGVMFCRDGC